MGWLEGVLTGYADRHYQIQKDKMRQAELAADREERVFQTLLNSQYPDIRDHAAAGILDLSSPRKRKGGVAGWMGEIEQTPYLEMVRRTRERIGADPAYAEEQLSGSNPYGLGSREPLGGTPPATPSVPSPAGSVPATGSAALPSTSPVTGGALTPATPAPASAAPPTPPPPMPGAMPVPGPPPGYQAAAGAGAPPMPQGAAPGAAPVPQGAPPAPPPPTPAPTPGQVSAGTPGATTQAVGAPAPVPRRRTQLPGIFPTASETAMDAARARSAGTDLGEQESYIRVAEAQGLTAAEGLQMWAESQMKARGGGAGTGTPFAWRPMEYTDPQGVKRRMLARTNRSTGVIEDINGQPLPPGATPVTPGLYPHEVAARRAATNPLLWNQALTQARAVLGVNATADEVIDFADQLFTQSQSMAPAAPAVPGVGGGPPGGAAPSGVPGAGVPGAPAPDPGIAA